MPPKRKGMKQRSGDAELSPSTIVPNGEAARVVDCVPSQPFGFGNMDIDAYREAAVKIIKERATKSVSSPANIPSYLKDLWDACLSSLFPPTSLSAVALFPSLRDCQKSLSSEWPKHFLNVDCLDPLIVEAALSQLILQRDFALGLLGIPTCNDAFKFLAVDATFLRFLKLILENPLRCLHVSTSCLPHIIRSLFSCEPVFLEIMLQLLPSSQALQRDLEPERMTQGAHLCHILQGSFGFCSADLEPLYPKLLMNPLASLSGTAHSGEWRAVTESPPQRYNIHGEALGRISKYCVDDEENEGCSCLHRRIGPDCEVLRRDHWSCCGGSNRDDRSCVNAASACQLQCAGLQCSLAHPLTVRVCLPGDILVNALCVQCGLDCNALSCVSTICNSCKVYVCLACSVAMNQAASPAKIEHKKTEASSSSRPAAEASGGTQGGSEKKSDSDPGGVAARGKTAKKDPVAVYDLMNPAVASFVNDCHSGAGWLLTKIFCDIIDNKQTHPHDLHTIQLLVHSLNMESYHSESVFCKHRCQTLLGALAAVLARENPFVYPCHDIPIDLRFKLVSHADVASASVLTDQVPYLDSIFKLIMQTKRFHEFADALVQKIHKDYPTPDELVSLVMDKNRLLITLEVAYFELKYPSSSKSKSGILKQLLEMGCFPRKFAVKAVLKSSRTEDAVNFFFTESRTASDEDDSQDANLTNTDATSESLKLHVSSPHQPCEKVPDAGIQKPDIEARINLGQLLVTISDACASLDSFLLLKEHLLPVLNDLRIAVEARASQQKSIPDSSCSTETERRLYLQSLMKTCSHSIDSLCCFSGHPLKIQSCQNKQLCSKCCTVLPSGSQCFMCNFPKPSSEASEQCDFSMCMQCGRELALLGSATYSFLEISSSIRSLECLIPNGKLTEDMKRSFSSIACSSVHANSPIVSFGWISPKLPPRPAEQSGEICGPKCTKSHSDDSSICIRCDRRFSSHKSEHLCNDGERGYFIVSSATPEGHPPRITGPQGSQRIDMRHSSDRPVSLVHSQAGAFSGKKWTCTIVNTNQRGQNTWIGLCDADVVARYVRTADFKGLGTKSNGFSIGFHHEQGVRVDGKLTQCLIACKDGDGIRFEYDEPGRRLDVFVARKLVYSHAGLPPNLMFAISSGDKDSKYAAMKCMQLNVPCSLDASCSLQLDSISKTVADINSWKSEQVISLLSLLSAFRTKPHYVLNSKFLFPFQATLLRMVPSLIESDDLNIVSSQPGVSDRILFELSCAVGISCKSLLLPCIAQLKRVSVALLQGRNTYSSASLSFLSDLYAVCSKGFAHATASAFDFLIRCLAEVQHSKSIVTYISVPRWVIEAIEPSRSFLYSCSMFGTTFPALLHAGWVDVVVKDKKSVRLSCEAAQALIHQYASKDSSALSGDSLSLSPLINRVAASINNELAENGLLHDIYSDCDVVQTPLHTASLPSSIHIGSCCIGAVTWFKERLCAQERLNEIEALTACCQDTRSAPAIVQSVLTDLVRRGYVVRKHGDILLVDSTVCSSKSAQCSVSETSKTACSDISPPSGCSSTENTIRIFVSSTSSADCMKQPDFRIPVNDSFTISQAVFFTIKDSVAMPPWTSSISSASSIPLKEFEIDLADTLNGLQNLEQCDDILKVARKFEECSGSVTAFVFNRDGTVPSSHTPAIISSIGFCPVCLDDQVQIFSSPCGHKACRGCYRELLQTAISDSGSPLLAKGHEHLISVTAIKCVASDCQQHLPFAFLKEVVPDLADATKRILIRTLLRALNNSPCPISSCLCGQSMLIGTSQDCEAICSHCGRFATIGDFKRKEIPDSWMPHPTISSDEIINWNMLNDVGNSGRRDLLRFKACPHCGTMTTRCGCDPKRIECDNLERCPNEKCDHIDCTVCKKRWCWVCGGPTCPTRCTKPALERTHRKEKFLLSQNAIMKLSAKPFRVDEQHLFQRARSEFLKLFYRGSDVVDVADERNSQLFQQSIRTAISNCDMDSVRFILFKHMLQISKLHSTFLLLAFANLPESRILQAVTATGSPLTIAMHLYDSMTRSQLSVAVTTFDPSISNSSLKISDDHRSATRPGSASSYPMARAPVRRGSEFSPGVNRMFCVCLERAPNNSNSTSFGLAAKSIRVEGSDGVGGTPGSWGIICQYGNGSGSTKVMASGRHVSTWRMLREGDFLRATFCSDGSLVVSLNMFECEYKFDLPSEVARGFGSSLDAEEDKYTFAMTFASDHCARICSP